MNHVERKTVVITGGASEFGRLVAQRVVAMGGNAVVGDVNEAGLAVTRPYDGNAATVGNGVMVALRAPSKETVDALHAKALELGGQDEGAPGPRGDGFYAGYFRDLDGNKLNAFFLG